MKDDVNKIIHLWRLSDKEMALLLGSYTVYNY